MESNVTSTFVDNINPLHKYNLKAIDGYGKNVSKTNIYYTIFDLIIGNEGELPYEVMCEDFPGIDYAGTATSMLLDIPKGATVQIHASSDSEDTKTFDYWLIGNNNITTNPYTFTMNDNMGIDCIYINTHKLTIKKDVNVSVKLHYNNSNINVPSPQQSYFIKENSNVKLTATPSSNFQFLHWDFGGGQTFSDNPYTFNIGTSNKVINTIYQSTSTNQSQYILKIDTNKMSGNVFILPLFTGYNYDFTINWGDGVIEYNNGHQDLVHQYSNKGIYNIVITGLVECIYQFDTDCVVEFTINSNELKQIEDGISLLHLEKLYIHPQWQKSLLSGYDVNPPNINCQVLPINIDNSTWIIYDLNQFSLLFNQLKYVHIDNFYFDDENITNINGLFKNHPNEFLDVTKFHYTPNNILSVMSLYENTKFDYIELSFPNATDYRSVCKSAQARHIDCNIPYGANNLKMDNAFMNTTQLTSFDFSPTHLHPDKIISGLDTMFKNSNVLAYDDNYDKLLNAWQNTSKSSVVFDAGNAKYSDDGKDARDYLTGAKLWTIIDLGKKIN